MVFYYECRIYTFKYIFMFIYLHVILYHLPVPFTMLVVMEKILHGYTYTIGLVDMVTCCHGLSLVNKQK